MKDKKLLNVVTYLVMNYPIADHLSNARVTKMVFLADWYHALHHQRQITGIRWFFDNYGPFVWDIRDLVEKYDGRFAVVRTLNAYGALKTQIAVKSSPTVTVPKHERESLDHVIAHTKDLSWSSFIRLIYSTYPISSSQRYSYLNLVEMAEQYGKTIVSQ